MKPEPDTLATMKEMAENYIKRETAELTRLLEAVAKATKVEIVGGQIVTEMKLSANDMEALCLRIPAECAFLQAKMTSFNIKQAFSELEIEDNITSSLSDMNGKGNAQERMRQAEQKEYSKIVGNMVNKMVQKGIQGCIERADKVYEAIKKIMDCRAKEGWFDRKGAN